MTTARQRMVLRAISEYSLSRGYPPTQREIADHLGFRYANQAARVLDELEALGLVTRQPRSPRALAITQAGWDVLADPPPKRRAIT